MNKSPSGKPGAVQYIYNLTFKFMPSLGYAATVSYVIVILVAVLSFLQFLVARDRKA